MSDRFRIHPALLAADAKEAMRRRRGERIAIERLFGVKPSIVHIRKLVSYACCNDHPVTLEYVLILSRQGGWDLDEDWENAPEDGRHPIFDILMGRYDTATALVLLRILENDGRYCRRLYSARWRGASILDLVYGWRGGDLRPIVYMLLSMGAFTRVLRRVPYLPHEQFRDKKYWRRCDVDKFIDSHFEVFAILCGEAATGRQLLPADIWRKVHYIARPGKNIVK